MGRRGPAPTPTRLKVLRGTARPGTSREPEPPDGALEPPDDLDPVARDEWLRVMGVMAAGVIRPVDAESLRVYAEAVSRYRAAAVALARSGPLVKGREGELVKNPLHQVVRDDAVLVRLFARELGLTPAARVGLVAAPEGPADPLSELRRRAAARRGA